MQDVQQDVRKDSFQVRDLLNIPIEEIRMCFNNCFENYYVPLHLTADQFLSKLRAERIRLDLSIGLFARDHLVGFILHGIDQFDRKYTAYNGGTGILPQYRGLGLTMKMYRHALDLLRVHQIERTILEVICENEPALRAYQKVGFSVMCRLECFMSPKIEGKMADPVISEIPIIDFDSIDIPASWPLAWQYSWNTINRSLPDYQLWIAGEPSAPDAYCVANSVTGRIAHFNCRDWDNGSQALAGLLHHMSVLKGGPLSAMHVDSRAEASIEFLKSIGFKPLISLWEMELRL